MSRREYSLGPSPLLPNIHSPPTILTSGIPRMNASISALLDLQVIDTERQKLKRAREGKLVRLADADKAAAAAEELAKVAQVDVDRQDALIRQYTTDVTRCDALVADLRVKQPEAKTNKEYMDLINAIESAKLEKVKREGSLKELSLRIESLQATVAAKSAKAAELRAAHAALVAADGGATAISPEEAELTARYEAKRGEVEPAFLDQYERLVKARAKSPLMRVDPKTRATPMGSILSQNAMEQIRAGKLVIDRQTNAILYLS